MQQLTLDFENIVHTRENNSHSEQILFDQYERLSNNCKKVYNALKSGGKWTGRKMIFELNILEYRKRIDELRKAGLEIKENVLKNGAKEWWL